MMATTNNVILNLLIYFQKLLIIKKLHNNWTCVKNKNGMHVCIKINLQHDFFMIEGK